MVILQCQRERDPRLGYAYDFVVDHQGKTLGQALLTLEIDVPEPVLAATPADAQG